MPFAEWEPPFPEGQVSFGGTQVLALSPLALRLKLALGQGQGQGQERKRTFRTMGASPQPQAFRGHIGPEEDISWGVFFL